MLVVDLMADSFGVINYFGKCLSCNLMYCKRAILQVNFKFEYWLTSGYQRVLVKSFDALVINA